MTVEKALALASLGLHVFPVASREGMKGLKIKDPIPLNGLKAGTTSIRRIEAMWSRNPEAWVGVWVGPSGIIVGDIDEHDGSKDGRVTLNEQGAKLTQTFNYGTLSGHGRHYVYAGDSIPNGKPFGEGQGVDRQSGDSYVIWHGPVPSSRDEFRPAPPWLLENVSQGLKLEKVDAVEYIDALPDEPMSRTMKAAYDRIPNGEFGRNDLYRRGVEIASLHNEGFKGAKVAFQYLAEQWLRGPYNTREYRTDLINTVGNAIAYARVNSPPADLPAQAAVAAPVAVEEGPDRIMSHRELMGTAYDVEWLIDGLLSTNGIGLITGRSNVGKTTAALQFAATLATGGSSFLQWELPAPRMRKVLFASLELEGWGMQQFAAPLGNHFDEEELGENLAYWAYGQPVLLTTDEGREKLLARLDEAQAEVLVIDSLGETSRSLQDEEQSAELFDFLKWLKLQGIATIAVHHHRKVTSENAGHKRRLNDLSDVYGGVGVTKQADMILDLDDQRTTYADPKGAEVVVGKVAYNLLKVRYAPKMKVPRNLVRDEHGFFSVEEIHEITQEERDAVTGVIGNKFGL